MPVKRYAHLSPSHLQQEIEKLWSFGKGTAHPNVGSERPKEGQVARNEPERSTDQDGSGGTGPFPTVSETVTYATVAPCRGVRSA